MNFKKALPPGTIFNTSEKKIETEIRKIYYDESKITENEPFENAQVWIRVNGLSDSERIAQELTDASIDFLIIEDIFNLTQRSKIEEIENGLFAIIKVSAFDVKDYNYRHDYLSIILKDNMVFTFNEYPPGILNIIEERLNNNLGKIRNHKANFLFYTIIDSLVDANIIFEHEINDILLSWEEKVLYGKIKNIDELHQIRKEVLLLKTNIFSIVESLDFIEDIYKNPQVSNLKKYYQDLIDHLYRLNNRLNLDWENIKTLYEMHMNNISERTNSIMKILTIFSAVFIPMSFLAGVFGMNFVYMEIFNNPNGIWVFIGLCFSIFLLMIGFFKYKKWL